MEKWLQSLVPWGLQVLLYIQSISGPPVYRIAEFFTFLGYPETYLVFLPFIYWCLNKRLGAALGYLVLLGAYLTDAIKYTFNIPRPSDPRLRILLPASGPSFLSGHALSSTTNWGYLAIRIRNLVLRIAAVVLTIFISLSRLVLAVHYPEDVIAGIIVGLIVLVGYALAEPALGRWLGAQDVVIQIMLAVLVPLLLLLVHPGVPLVSAPAQNAARFTGALAGMGIGLIMENASLRFCVDGPWKQRLLRLPVGLLVVIGVFVVPNLFLRLVHVDFRVDMVVLFVAYGLAGWGMAFLAPWVFLRLGLAERETPSAAAVPRAEAEKV